MQGDERERSDRGRTSAIATPGPAAEVSVVGGATVFFCVGADVGWVVVRRVYLWSVV